MRVVKLLLCVVPAACLLAQTPQPGTSAAKPSAKPAATKPAATKPAPKAIAPGTTKVTAQPVTPDGTPEAPAAAVPVDPNKVVLRIGDQTLTAADFDAYIATLPDQYRRFAMGPGKRQFAEQLIRMRLLSQAAREHKLDQKREVQLQMEIQQSNLLAGLMFQQIAEQQKVDDAAVQAYYDQHKNEYEQVRARHILIRVQGSPVPAEGKADLTDAEALAKAQEIRKRLQGGEDFAKLAQAESYDSGSGAQGGDLGSFARGRMVPEFEKAAFSLPVGEISEPVKTPFGYHIIQVEQHEAKKLDDLRAEIEGKLRPDLARKALETMRQQASVTLDDAYFGPAQESQPVVAQ
jgi:peptidyl-prolyl cis-trans isomerase C